jgi:hypothetical protein
MAGVVAASASGSPVQVRAGLFGTDADEDKASRTSTKLSAGRRRG